MKSASVMFSFLSMATLLVQSDLAYAEKPSNPGVEIQKKLTRQSELIEKEKEVQEAKMQEVQDRYHHDVKVKTMEAESKRLYSEGIEDLEKSDTYRIKAERALLPNGRRAKKLRRKSREIETEARAKLSQSRSVQDEADNLKRDLSNEFRLIEKAIRRLEYLEDDLSSELKRVKYSSSAYDAKCATLYRVFEELRLHEDLSFLGNIELIEEDVRVALTHQVGFLKEKLDKIKTNSKLLETLLNGEVNLPDSKERAPSNGSRRQIAHRVELLRLAQTMLWHSSNSGNKSQNLRIALGGFPRFQIFPTREGVQVFFLNDDSDQTLKSKLHDRFPERSYRKALTPEEMKDFDDGIFYAVSFKLSQNKKNKSYRFTPHSEYLNGKITNKISLSAKDYQYEIDVNALETFLYDEKGQRIADVEMTLNGEKFRVFWDSKRSRFMVDRVSKAEVGKDHEALAQVNWPRPLQGDLKVDFPECTGKGKLGADLEQLASRWSAVSDRNVITYEELLKVRAVESSEDDESNTSEALSADDRVQICGANCQKTLNNYGKTRNVHKPSGVGRLEKGRIPIKLAPHAGYFDL